MDKKNFINAVANESGENKETVRRVVDASLAIMTHVLKAKDEVTFVGFGRLYTIEQTARLARNPQTGTPVMITPRTSARFRPGKFLLDDLNKK
ncbi:HU family DNA-binding protein [uncultured Parabacteroides sp.]|jgi:DNA-binding protein HU-beta|uniref:HU family DNA-binding protein n=1 Tax=uncultured Parabacteroides sp. TaxID=512312 RepID=UPI0025D9173C|nr:HU family DNA-binding protein [uncultured Parabacteroides sp.]